MRIRQILRLHGRRGKPVGTFHLYDGMTKIEVPKDTKGYHLMTDLTNQSINWMRSIKSLTPDKPFFIYFAPGATHAPHHVPKEWIAKYNGKLNQGWDKLRKEIISTAGGKSSIVYPKGTKLTYPEPEAIKDWDKLALIKRINFLPARWKFSPDLPSILIQR